MEKTMPVDHTLFPEGMPRCSLPKFLAWIGFLLLVLGWGVIGGPVGPHLRVEPDQHERLLRLRPVDHLRPGGDRLGGRGLFYRLPDLYHRQEGTEGHHQFRGDHRVHLLQRGHSDPDHRRGSAVAVLVRLLAPQRPFHADRSNVLHHPLPGRAGHRIPAPGPRKPGHQ